MSIYVLPALLALLIKIYVLALAHLSKTSRVFSAMVLVFALHNLTEVIAYFQFSLGNVSELLLRAYYAATLAMLCCMCLYCIEVTQSARLKKLVLPISIWLAVGSLLVFGTSLFVAGVEPLSYSVTAERGPYYWVFSLTTLLSLMFVAGSLVYGYRQAKSHTIQIQCLYSLFALLPIVVLGLIIVPLMLTDSGLNAAGFLPLCTTAFLLITLRSEAKHKFTDVRRFLPFSKERKITSQIQGLISKFSMDEISYKEMSNEFEKIALQHKLDQADNSVSEAARLLKIKRTTLYSMLDRHGLKRD